MRARFLATTVAACGTLLVLGAASASAAPTEVLYEGTPQKGARITVTATAGEANEILVKDHRVPGDVHLSIRDSAAGVTIASSPYCSALSSNEVSCETIGLERVNVQTGDREDVVVVNNRGLGDRGRRPLADHLEAPIFVATGLDEDLIWMKSGFGVAHGWAGNDTVAGGTRGQRLFGDAGNDLVGNAGGGKDFCDGGIGDDRGQVGCEVIRSLEGEPFFFDLGAELAKPG